MLAEKGDESPLGFAVDSVVETLVDGRLDVSFLLADVEIRGEILDGIVGKTKLVFGRQRTGI